MKTCTACATEKDISAFGKDRHARDGRTHQCKDCRNTHNRKQVAAGVYVRDQRAYMKANKDRYNKNRREKLKKDPEARAKRYGRHKKWRKERAEQARAGANRYLQRRRDNDSVFRHRCLISNLIRIYFRRGGWKKKSKTQDILGCDFNTLHTHLILSAINRYGFWTDAHDYHIDHIIPVSLATNETELIHLNHYTNLQLLTPEDNLAKSNKIAA